MNNTTISMLKNQQYSGCIESCNECMMACEACCTECMTTSNTQMAGMMGRCMMMCRDCADMCRMASMMMCRGSEYQSRCATCAPTCARHAQWSARRWATRWKCASNVQMHAGNAHRNAET